MPYCITLRSRPDARVTGWYAGRNCRWSTDHKRHKRFNNQQDASAVCQELRSLCPRNAKVINVEVAQEDFHLGARANAQILPLAARADTHSGRL